MLAKIYSIFPYGMEGKVVEVEVQTERGLRSFSIVGLPDEAVKEAMERVSLALTHAGFLSPNSVNKKVTVNLAPADVKKQGAYFDLAIAIGFLASTSQLPPIAGDDLFFGELAFDGALRPLKGALALAASAAQKGFRRLFVPLENAKELSLISELGVYPIARLEDAVNILKNPEDAESAARSQIFYEETPKENESNHIAEYDFAEIRGQEFAKRALEIAAAGRHHVFLLGPPGAGKSILAKAFPSLLPPLTREQALEVGKVLSIAGLLDDKREPAYWRQMRAPHHSASASALLGGGNPLRFGEITLAHQGVLFLDEFPEFRRDVLEALRQPLENRTIHVARASGTFLFPADFQLIAAANPCPCGFKDDPKFPCVCTNGSISRYERKLSGPLIDRIDLWVHVPRLTKEEMLSKEKVAQPSWHIQERVARAQSIQRERFGSDRSNSAMTLKELKIFCKINRTSEELLGKAIETFGLSVRSYHKILKISRTIADLEGSEDIRASDISEALQYRRRQ